MKEPNLTFAQPACLALRLTTLLPLLAFSASCLMERPLDHGTEEVGARLHVPNPASLRGTGRWSCALQPDC